MSYIVLTYVVALRGKLGLILELRGLNEQLMVERKVYCMVVLYGKLKGKEQFREHKIPCISKTESGIDIKYVSFPNRYTSGKVINVDN